MALSFDATYYLSQRPDVFNAFVATNGSTGLTWAQFAERHYNTHGRFEGSNPNTTFNTLEYLKMYPDVAAAGINPFTHYLNAGINEGRAPSASFPSFASFDATTYLNANADLKAAGITTAQQAYAHFVRYGQFESRPGAPAVDTSVPGTTYTLTANLDNYAGTANNDTFNASVSATAADNTLGLADVLNGGAGKDTLNVTAAVLATDIAVPSGNIQNIETVNIRALDNDGTVGTDAATFNASTASGVTSVNSDRSSSNLKVTGLANGAAIGVIGDGVVTNGTTSFAYATASAAQTINISNGVKAGNITATASTGVTTATINSKGAANTVGTILLDSAAGATVTSLTVNADSNLTATLTAGDFANTSALTVKGAASSVDLGTAANFKTIDASGLAAGGLTIGLGSNLTSFKGGAGNDVVTTAALGTSTAGAVDAGAGTADVLIVAAGADVDTAAEAAVYKNFEVLRNSGTTDVDVSLLSGITTVEVASANAGATNMTAAQAANVKVLVSNATNTFSLKTATGTSDVLGLVLAPASAATVSTAIDVTGATVTGFETINVVSSSGTKGATSGTGNDLAFAAAGDLTAINVSGEYDLTINTANVTKAVTISTTQTGTANLNVTGNLVKGSIVNTTANADTITTTGAVAGTSGEYVTYNAGAGNDTVNTTAAAVNNTSAANASLKIDGGAGVDTVNFTAADSSLVDANFQYVTGFEKIGFTGGGSISLTSGGFFDNNFKASGAELTGTFGTSGGAGKAASIDLTSFSGVAKVTLTEIATGDATNSFTVNTGGGADEITVTTNGTLTTANTINTGVGNDKITLTNAALGGGGSITVDAGAGDDVIVGGASASTITGGTGADTMTGNGGADVFNYTSLATVLNQTGITLATADTITDFVSGTDQIKIGTAGSGTNYTEAAQVADFATAKAAADTAMNGTVLYHLTSTAADGGLLFVDSNSDGTADAVIKLTGITDANFASTDLIA